MMYARRQPGPMGVAPIARAFSLIELLVSIAVVAVLVSLLLPSLRGARESGRAAVCSSNLHQLSVALDAYAGDHADRYAPGAADALANLSRWHGSRPTPGAPFVPAGAPLTPYLTSSGDHALIGSLAARSCPTFAPTASRLGAARVGFERSAGGYGYNNAFVGTERERVGVDPSTGRNVYRTVTDRLGAARHRLAAPSDTLGFADSALADGNALAGIIEYSFIEPRFWPESPASRADPSIHFRHGTRAQTAWMDGHVVAHRRTFSWSSGAYAADPTLFEIGWFDARDDNQLFGDR